MLLDYITCFLKFIQATIAKGGIFRIMRIEDMHLSRVSLYLQDVTQVGSADLRVLRGVERDGSYPDKGKDARFRVPPQHHPRAVLCLAVEHHLVGSWQLPGS